jgi:hemolysin III
VPIPGRYTRTEELLHAATHGVGLLLSVAGLMCLTVLAGLRGDAWHIVSCSIYGATLVLLYAASTIYHAASTPWTKSIFRSFDHACIYLLIAGTYTPFTLVTLRGGWGWSLFGVVWGLALLGVVKETGLTQGARALSLVLYVGIGWLGAVAVKPLLESLPVGGIGLVLLGGVAYTGGVAFYCWHRLPYNHVIWHVFVLAGSVFHFAAVVLYVIPRPAA